MNKLPLNQKGIKALTQQLYALPDVKLANEILAVRIDFKKWLCRKFELKPDETNPKLWVLLLLFYSKF